MVGRVGTCAKPRNADVRAPHDSYTRQMTSCEGVSGPVIDAVAPRAGASVRRTGASVSRLIGSLDPMLVANHLAQTRARLAVPPSFDAWGKCLVELHGGAFIPEARPTPAS